MASRDDLVLYLNLTRKELQGLCKKHKLPANRSHTELAKSLASYFKKKSTYSSPSKERSSNAASLYTTCVSESKHNKIVTHAEESSGGKYERTNSLEFESIRLASFTKEKGDDNRRHSLTNNVMENSAEMDGRSSKKVDDPALNVVCSHLTNNDTTEGFRFSTLDRRDGNRRQLAANTIQITTASQLASKCHDGISKNDSQNSLGVPNSGPKSLSRAAASCGTANLAPDSSKHRKFDVPSDDTYIKVSPSFQFFAMNEEGLNLYVDLNSSPSDWINSLKEEVCFSQGVEHCKASNLCKHSGSYLNLHDHTKTSTSGNIGFDVENNGLERNNCCIYSSLSATVSENCHSKTHAADATAVTSRSPALTSSKSTVKTSCYLEETRLLSSSYITSSKVQNNMTFNTVCCSGEGKLLSQEMLETSLCTGKASESIPDSSLKFSTSLDSSSHEGMKNPDTVDCHTLKIASIASSNVGGSALGDTLANISKKVGSPVSTRVQDNIEASHVSNVESEVSGNSNKLPNSCKLSGQFSLDCPSTDAQSDIGSVAHRLNHYSCGSRGSSASEGPTSALEEELDRGIPVKEKESLGYSQLKSYVDKTCKRSRGPEFLEEFQSKRQLANGENKNEAVVNLRSTKTWDEESICGSVAHPRRSSRLISKCDRANSAS